MQAQEVPHPASVAPVALLPSPDDRLHARFLRVLLVIWRAMTISHKVAIGSAIVGFFILVGLFGPFFMTINPNATSHLFIASPSVAHWLGTTVVGEDIFSQLIYGTRTSVFWGLGTGLLVTLISVVVGLVGGYVGGWLDDVLTLLTNVSLVLPALPLAIVLAAYFPRGPLTISLVIVFTNWAWQARVLRSQTLSMRSREFVTAARASGEHPWRMIFSEIFPNEIGLVVAGFVSTTIYIILAWAALEFLGLGDGTIPSWGSMLYWAQQAGALGGGLWWWFIPPGACIAILGAGLSLINFGIDEIADPRLRREHPVPEDTEVQEVSEGPDNPAWGAGNERDSEGPDLLRNSVGPDNPAWGAGNERDSEGDARTNMLLEVKNLSVDYLASNGTVHAVTDVSFTLRRGEILGLAGESGSGKSTLAYAITRLLRPPAVITGGEILYYPGAIRETQIVASTEDGKQSVAGSIPVPQTGSAINLLQLSPAQLRDIRWDDLAIVFQSAMNALNPVMTIGAQIMDVLRTHRSEMNSDERKQRAIELLQLVGIAPDRLRSYPHELSGGMRQRAIIAIALALSPEILIMDEPTTALDVVVQRDILTEILRLQKKLGFSVIFITHDLSLLLEVADHVAIMYAGRIVEKASGQDIYQYPRHPYSYGLLNSFPALHGPRHKMSGIPGSPPDLRAVPPGCAFHPRCPFAFDTCRTVLPALLRSPSINRGLQGGRDKSAVGAKELIDAPQARFRPLREDDPGQTVACHLYDPRFREEPPSQSDLARKYETLAERSGVQ